MGWALCGWCVTLSSCMVQTAANLWYSCISYCIPVWMPTLGKVLVPLSRAWLLLCPRMQDKERQNHGFYRWIPSMLQFRSWMLMMWSKRHCGCCGFWPLTLAWPWLKQPPCVCLSVMYLRVLLLRGSWGLLLSAVPLPAVHDPVLARQPAQNRRLTDIQTAVRHRLSLHVTWHAVIHFCTSLVHFISLALPV